MLLSINRKNIFEPLVEISACNWNWRDRRDSSKHLSEKGIGSLAVTNRTQEKAESLPKS